MIELLNEDNMQVMARYPDKYFDLAIVDPPYGIDIMHKGGYPESKNFIQWERKDWDKAIPTAEYFSELKRVSKHQIIWGGNYYAEYLGNFNTVIIWDKMQRKFTNSDFEMAWTSFSTKNRAFNLSRVQAYANQTKIHPTQKPVQLYKWLLEHYAKPNDKILDTHLGSGSIAIACHDMGFDLVACEIDKDYYEAAVKRFSEQTKQLKLIA